MAFSTVEMSMYCESWLQQVVALVQPSRWTRLCPRWLGDLRVEVGDLGEQGVGGADRRVDGRVILGLEVGQPGCRFVERGGQALALLDDRLREAEVSCGRVGQLAPGVEEAAQLRGEVGAGKLILQRLDAASAWSA